MKTNVFIAIGWRIILLFTLGMMATFIPAELRGFFGDTLHVHADFCRNAYCSQSNIDGLWEWGARHYWYFWMMFVLFILALANSIIGIFNVVKKNYDTSSW